MIWETPLHFPGFLVHTSRFQRFWWTRTRLGPALPPLQGTASKPSNMSADPEVPASPILDTEEHLAPRGFVGVGRLRGRSGVLLLFALLVLAFQPYLAALRFPGSYFLFYKLCAIRCRCGFTGTTLENRLRVRRCPSLRLRSGDVTAAHCWRSRSQRSRQEVKMTRLIHQVTQGANVC